MIDLRAGATLIAEWLWLVFWWPTRRIVRIAPGTYLQIPRGMTDREVADRLRAALNRHQQQRKGK
jgi:hypothetical protein